ncbi:MAG TPA: methyltransferase domain-containing protein [Polyangia bacterium]|jgi:23S rRNA (uracil1939-C5)-methyltransferase/tRNA (uracil-5-)-methyltransferase|nr:methyltransferase domain-containing protein [Polyangia bacterium]
MAEDEDARAPEGTGEDAPLPTPSAPVAPRCALFGTCGGCQLQHVPYDEQLAWKAAEVRRLFAEALPGLAIAVDACVGSPREYGYRSKLTPHFQRPRGQVPPIGFLGTAMPRRTIDVPQCPIATDAINERLTLLRAEVTASIKAYKLGASLLLREAASGVTTDGRETVTEQVGNLTLNFAAHDFFQNNPFLLPALAAHVAAEARTNGARFLVDAYCGSGLLALTSAPGFEQVVGVELSPSSVRWASENAVRNGRANCTFTKADATTIFAGLPFAGKDAAVIVDPPRKGCSPAFLAQLVAFAPRAIVYVSCNPATQVRDLVALRAAAYRVARVRPFDMFPQTRHLECVATLTRG